MENLPQKEIKLVSVYGRVSTSNQEDAQTIEAQLSEVREFAKKHGYTIVTEYVDEDWSGDTRDRPKLDQLRLDAKLKLWEAVICYDPDRLGRQLFIQQVVIDELKQREIEVLFVTMPPIKNSNDELLFGVRGLFSAYEKAKITERFRIGKVNRVKNNHQVLTTEAAYGYDYIPNAGKKGSDTYIPGHYEVNEREKENLEQIFHWVANDGLTLRTVVKKLHEENIPPRKSKRGVWSTSTLSTMLRNTAYIGKARWGASYAVIPENPTKYEKYKKQEKTSRRMRPEKDWLFADVPVIIHKDIFELAGQNLRKNFETLGRNKKNDFLLAGSIFCNCGGRRAGEGVQHGKHLYYRCENRVRTFPLPPTCKESSINAKNADKNVWLALEEFMKSPEMLREQSERWQKNGKKKTKWQPATDINAIRKEISKLQLREDRLAIGYSKEVFSLEKFEEYAKPLRTRIDELKEQIQKARAEEIISHDDISLPSQNEIEVFAKESREILVNLNFKVKQSIVRRVIEKATVAREEIQFHGSVPLNLFENVVLLSKYRHSRSAERGEVHTI